MNEPGLVPARGPLILFLGLGLVAVFVLPSIPEQLPLPGRLDHSRYALTCAGLIALSAVYLYVVAARYLVLDVRWVAWNLVFVTGLAIVKFILSPIAYQKSGTTLSGFLVTGVAVMPIYLAALSLIMMFARRMQTGTRLSSSAAVAVGLALLAVVVRSLVTRILSTDAPDIMGVGLVLPSVVAVASFSLMQGFERARASMRSSAGIALTSIVGLHLLWVVYMYGLFS